jgi:hypothetical protein
LRLTGSLSLFFAIAALAMCVYGLVILGAVASGSWFDRPVQGWRRLFARS